MLDQRLAGRGFDDHRERVKTQLTRGRRPADRITDPVVRRFTCEPRGGCAANPGAFLPAD